MFEKRPCTGVTADPFSTVLEENAIAVPISAAPKFGPVPVRVDAEGRPDHYRFTVLAGAQRDIDLVLQTPGQTERITRLEQFGADAKSAKAEARAGDRYCFRIYDDGVFVGEFPDPGGYQQEDGHYIDYAGKKCSSWSIVTDPAEFKWQATEKSYKMPPLEDLALMEIDVETATPEGTLAALCERLPSLQDLGVNALELMPLNDYFGPAREQFGWGYEPASLGSVRRNVGGPQALLETVEHCHAAGVAVVLDVVVNHWGPEHGYAQEFHPDLHGPFAVTPWGWGPNWRNATVVEFIADSLVRPLRDFHIDGLRIDAAHWIGFRDQPLANPKNPDRVSPDHPLAMIMDRIYSAINRPFFVVAEYPGDQRLLVQARERGGLGIMTYNDPARHAVFAAMTGESAGFYGELFPQRPDAVRIAYSINNNFCFGPELPAVGAKIPEPLSAFGSSAADIPASGFLNWISANHDWRGNAKYHLSVGEVYGWAVANALLLWQAMRPGVPALFANELLSAPGQMYPWVGYRSPEQAFKIYQERLDEQQDLLADDKWQPPNPCDPAVACAMRINWDRPLTPRERAERDFAAHVVELRRNESALRCCIPGAAHAVAIGDRVVVMRRDDLRKDCDGERGAPILTILNTHGASTLAIPEDHPLFELPDGMLWKKVMSSTDPDLELADAVTAPIAVELRDGRLAVSFVDSGAVVLKAVPRAP